MMLDLGSEETELLSRILSAYLSDLRMEIVETENHDMREDLKNDEATIGRLIQRLSDANVTTR